MFLVFVEITLVVFISSEKRAQRVFFQIVSGWFVSCGIYVRRNEFLVVCVSLSLSVFWAWEIDVVFCPVVVLWCADRQ